MSPRLVQHRVRQLPAEATGFVGREAELAQITALLDAARLVTVTGPGGVGKTRVALRAAARAGGRFPDGVFLIELSALRDRELLANVIATVLGLSGGSGLEVILRHLRDRTALLILDTCEHLIEACAMLAEAILTEAPGVTLLATSRQPLGVPGESAYPLPPLSVPAPPEPGAAVSMGLGAAGSGDAVELFAQRAAEAMPGFRVTPGNKDDVVRVCRQLDGIPLAIELAAVRLRALPLAELAARLGSRFQVLTGGRRGSVPRHRTLRDAIGWSYDLCTAQEQALWARLSVFAGGFDIGAVAEVCEGSGASRDALAETVIRLVDKSVLIHESAPAWATGVSARGTQYRMLETIREFGAEHLAASGEEEAIRDGHLARYLAMARHFAGNFLADQLGQYRRLSSERANIRAALEYALNGPPGSPERDKAGAALAISLWGYWQVSGEISEGRHWLGKVLDKFPGPCRERAWALMVLGYIGAFQGRGDVAVDEAAEGLRVAAEAGDELGVARGHLYHMIALTFAGRLDEAIEAEAEAAPRLLALNDRVGLHCLDAQAGQLYVLRGDVERSLARAKDGLRRFGDTREHWVSSYLNTIIGMSLFHRPGQEAPAAQAVSEALLAKHEIGDCVGTAYSLEMLGWLAARAGHGQRTAWLLGAADRLWARAGGRLAGSEILEEYHRGAEAAARAKLGGRRYAALHAEGARRPLDTIVSLALAGAPELPADPAVAPAGGGLTSRELEIAGLVASGLSNREIAGRMVISKRTVDAHVEHIYAKLGISSRVQLTHWARDGGMAALT